MINPSQGICIRLMGALDDGPNQADLHRLPLVKQQESHGNLERHQQ